MIVTFFEASQGLTVVMLLPSAAIGVRIVCQSLITTRKGTLAVSVLDEARRAVGRCQTREPLALTKQAAYLTHAT
jgi:hypothetical protein